METFKEFANFIIHNKAMLAATYVKLLEESGHAENIAHGSRLTSARKLLNAVVEAYQTNSFDPLTALFVGDEQRQHWSTMAPPPQPILEVECLGRTLTPVVTNLDAGKFLWRMLAEVRAIVFQTIESAPPLVQDLSVDGEEDMPKGASAPQRESEEWLRLLFNAALDAIIIMDDTGLITDWNIQAEVIFGWSRPEIIGQRLSDTIISPPYRAEHKQGLEHFLATGEGPILNKRIEVMALHRDGHEFPVELTVSPAYWGERVSFSAFVRDIAERVRLEQQIQESLERRNRQMETSTEIAQEIALTPALDDLFRQVVNLVQERFGYYHAHVYTLEGEVLVMQEGVGEAGRQMKMAGYQMALTTAQNLVARAARTSQPVLVTDVSQEQGWLPNPLLPETKSALAVPIKLKNEVLGVLEAQSDKVGGVGEEDRLLLMGLCGQIAVAINSHRLEAGRVQAETRLREHETRFAGILEIVPEAIISIDQAGRIMLFNQGAEQIFGYTPTEVAGQPLGLLLPDRFTVAHQEHVLDFAASTDSARKMGGRRKIYGRRKNGQEFPAEASISKFEVDGQPIFTAVLRDITERMQAEEELAKFKLGIERSSDAIFLTKTDGTIIYVNSAFEEIYGYNKEEALGQTPRILKSGVIPQEGYKRFWETLLAKKVVAGEIINKTKDGRLIDVEGSNNPVLDEGGNITGFLAIHRDITERKQSEVEREQLLAETEHRARELAIIQNVTVAINSATEFPDSLATVAGYLRELAPLEVMTLATYTPGEQDFRLFAVGVETDTPHFAQRDLRLPLAGSGPGWVITHNDVWLDEDFRETRPFMEDEQLVAEGLAARLLLPLRLGGQVIGTLNLASSQPGAFSEDHLPLLWQVADQMASTLARSHLFELIQRHAHREQTIREITDKMRAAASLEELVKTTAEELGQRLSAGHTVVELGIEPESGLRDGGQHGASNGRAKERQL